jgi:alpha-beta hydrolase superfamily lysophospholipase
VNRAAPDLWAEYLVGFGLREEQLREGNYPRKLVQQPSTDKAIVLVHGLTDSPYLMLALAEHFYQRLGYSVYLPLLQCHGLREPEGMRGVNLAAWLENVRFAVETARERNTHVAVGGLSTGGTLGLYLGCTDPRLTGGIYLFSVALGLADHGIPGLGWLKETLLRSGLLTLVASKKPLLGDNPYRYQRVPFNSARELVKLMTAIRALLTDRRRYGALPQRVFSAWTEVDQVIRVASIRRLADYLAPENLTTFPIDKHEQVEHACVVLREDIYAIGSGPPAVPLEKANPHFAAMMAAIDRFESSSSRWAQRRAKPDNI